LAHYTSRGNGCFAYRLSQSGKRSDVFGPCWNFHANPPADRYGYRHAQADRYGYSHAQADGYGYSHAQADGYPHAQADRYSHAQTERYTVGYATQHQQS
jgi:hypothetical protein